MFNSIVVSELVLNLKLYQFGMRSDFRCCCEHKISFYFEENINRKTNRLGKKQITWFKKENRLKMVTSENPEDVYKDIMEIINE